MHCSMSNALLSVCVNFVLAGKMDREIYVARGTTHREQYKMKFLHMYSVTAVIPLYFLEVWHIKI